MAQFTRRVFVTNNHDKDTAHVRCEHGTGNNQDVSPGGQGEGSYTSKVGDNGRHKLIVQIFTTSRNQQNEHIKLELHPGTDEYKEEIDICWKAGDKKEKKRCWILKKLMGLFNGKEPNNVEVGIREE